MLQAVRRHAVEPFHDTQWHWTAVLCLQVTALPDHRYITNMHTYAASPERHVSVVGYAAGVRFSRNDAGVIVVSDFSGMSSFQ